MRFAPDKTYRLSVYDTKEYLASKTYEGFMDKSQVLWIAEGLASRYYGRLHKVNVYCYNTRKSISYNANGKVIK